jgi:hypothetical protein
MHKKTRLFAVMIMVLGLFASMAFATGASPEYKLRDYLGRNWQNDLVEYPISAAEIKEIAGTKLMDQDGKEAIYQIDAKAGKIAFQANIKPFGESRYSFKGAAASTQTDLAIQDVDAHVELANSKAGIRIAKGLMGKTSATPILSWRLASGTWAGKVQFTAPQSVKAHAITVIERGPVRARVQSRTVFANGDTWVIDFELLAGEEVVKVTETFKCKKKRTIEFFFTDNYAATHALLRASSRHPFRGKKYDFGDLVQVELKPVPGERYLLQMEPWIHWGGVCTLTSSFALTDKDWKDVFMFAVCAPEKWVDPKITPSLRAANNHRLTLRADGGAAMPFDIYNGQREYLIGSVKGDQDRNRVTAKYRGPLQVQVNQIKYSDHPLDRVKDYILEWPNKGAKTAAFFSKADKRRLLKGYKVKKGQIASLRKKRVHPYTLEEFLPVYMATKNKRVEKQLIDMALAQIQERVDQITMLEEWVVTVGMAPHHYNSLMTVGNVVAAIYDSPQLTRKQRTRLKAQLAFLYYTWERPAFCSPERGFAGFLNMTASVYGVRSSLAAAMPGHPKQKAWQRDTVAYMKKNWLDRWTDENGEYHGGYIESLHYASITYEIVLAALYSAYSSGADKEAIFHPAVKLLGQWYAESATPRDSRILNWRHTPPVGHVYKFEVYPSIHAILAFMWKDKDPEFAGNMAWMQLQQGNTREQTTGGFLPTFAGYRKLFMANDVKPIAPNYTSRHWKETSVLLRSHYNHQLENMLYLIAGQGHSHYDMDSGSVTLWGKGEIIADDFGYYSYAPASDHSMIDSSVAPPKERMRVEAFEAGDAVDYTRGVKAAWTRRLSHVKHGNPQGPNYFVIQDALGVKAPAIWRLWLTAKKVKVKGNVAVSTGLDRIESDIHFAALPQKAKVRTEEKTRTPYGINHLGKYRGRVPTTQTGLIVNAPSFKRMLTLVFPRLKGQKPPKVESIANGAGFKIVTRYGTDYLFLSDKAVSFKEGKLSFRGTAGFARVKGGKAVLELQEPGKISYGDKNVVKKATARDLKNTNMIVDGELNTGKWSIFPEQKAASPFEVSLLKAEENPELVKLGLKGKYAQKVVCKTKDKMKWRRALALTHTRVFIDPERTYRVRGRVYIPGKHRVYLQSYGHDAKRKQVKTPEGRVWAWFLEMNGPTQGFVEFQAILGPEGSGANRPFIPGTIVLPGLGCRVYDEGDGEVYFDDVIIEEVVEE